MSIHVDLWDFDAFQRQEHHEMLGSVASGTVGLGGQIDRPV